VVPGSTIAEAAVEAGVRIDTACGGFGTCGRCRVQVTGDLTSPTHGERAFLTSEELAAGVRLACRAQVTGDVSVDQILGRGEVEELHILDHSLAQQHLTGVARTEGVGVAIDVGTTTLAISLMDLASSVSFGASSAMNPQVQYGADIMSRLSCIADGRFDELRGSLLEEARVLIQNTLDAHEVSTSDIRRVIVAGNTVMTHVYMGVDPSGMAAAPYEPAFLDPLTLAPEEFGCENALNAEFMSLPAASAFIGGDVVGGLLATRLDKRFDIALYIDLGTNGEIVLHHPEKGLLACTTAAGPAFEGASIECGMRAVPGAIEHVSIENDDILYRTIGNLRSRGICGSGLLDAVAALVLADVVDETGRIDGPRAPEMLHRVAETDDGRRIWLDEGAGIFISQKDIRQVQLAKGAVRAGLEILLEETGIGPEEVDAVVIAGGFGYHLRPGALCAIGLLPTGWEDRVEFVGNAAMAGAEVVLLEPEAIHEATEIAHSIKTVDLATHPSFQDKFIASMSF